MEIGVTEYVLIITTLLSVLTGLAGIVREYRESKRGERESDANLKMQTGQLGLERERAGVDIMVQQSQNQLQISQAQQELITALGEKIKDYEAINKQLGEMFDQAECTVQDTYSSEGHKQIMQLLRRTRREVGL